MFLGVTGKFEYHKLLMGNTNSHVFIFTKAIKLTQET